MELSKNHGSNASSSSSTIWWDPNNGKDDTHGKNDKIGMDDRNDKCRFLEPSSHFVNILAHSLFFWNISFTGSIHFFVSDGVWRQKTTTVACARPVFGGCVCKERWRESDMWRERLKREMKMNKDRDEKKPEMRMKRDEERDRARLETRTKESNMCLCAEQAPWQDECLDMCTCNRRRFFFFWERESASFRVGFF